MNYFSVPSVAISGVQAFPVLVESAQSRRLPYLQVLGASPSVAAELRERVIAALDSCRIRLPGRRITVRFLPGLAQLPLDSLDLPVAMAILGGASLVPGERLKDILVVGALGLDGSIRPTGNAGALRRIFSTGAYASALLAWEESGFLADAHLQRGGGFRTLSEAVAFLRGGTPGSRHQAEWREAKPPSPVLVWDQLPGIPVLKRVLEISAAGMHHVLLQGPASIRADLYAHALSLLLPPLDPAGAEEVRAVYALAGVASPPARPFHAFGSAPRLPPLMADRRFARQEEVMLSHRGVLFLDRLTDHESQLFPFLKQPMRAGMLSVLMGKHCLDVPLEPLLLARIPSCLCGAKGDASLTCVCRPTEARRQLRRRESLLAQPFDLFLEAAPEPERAHSSLEETSSRICQARRLMMARQGCLNGRLPAGEPKEVKKWRDEAEDLSRTISARCAKADASGVIARIALTISDLRNAPEVAEADVLEAAHYLPRG